MTDSRRSVSSSIYAPALLSEERDASSESADVRWTKLATAIARAVRRQCPQWLRDHAQDIAQAALIKVMASPRNGEGDRQFTSFYLYRVAHSAVVDEIRRCRRRREVTLDVVTEAGEGHVSVEPAVPGDPEGEASFRELGAAVRDCLMAMKVERRLAVMLYLQNHTVPEAARILGWPVKRTENLVYRGLANLRDCLRSKGHQP